MIATTQVVPGRWRMRIGVAVGAAAILLVTTGCGSDTGTSDTLAGSSSTTVVATSAPSTSTPGGGSGSSSTTTTSITAPEPPTADSSAISIDALGPLWLGMTRADAGALGLGVGEVGCGNLRSVTGGAGELTVALDDAGVITGVSTTDPAFETLSGIRVGATEADLQAAYGANLVASSFEGNVGPVDAFQLRSDQAVAADRYVWFTMIDGHVTLIALLGGDATPGSMLC